MHLPRRFRARRPAQYIGLRAGVRNPAWIIGAMTKALVVTSSFLPGHGGIESFLAQLMAELRPQCAVLAPGRRDGKAVPGDLGYPAIGYPGSMLIPTRKVAGKITELADRHDTDRVLFGTPWPLALLGPRLARAGLKYAVIVHGAELLVPSAIPVVRARLGRALAGADLLLAVSHFTARNVRQLVERHATTVPPIEILRPRVDLDRFHPDADATGVRRKLGIDERARVVLAFGRLVRRKGVHRLIHAMPEIRRNAQDAVLVVAGTGPRERSLHSLARRINSRVLFTGRVDDADTPSLYATADVFALPVADRFFGLDVEGLGVVLLEASACETPCVTGRSGGTPEAVINERTGFVVNGRDVGQLVDRITFLLEEPERAQAMGRAARRHVETEFSRRSLPAKLIEWLG
jgi:phosphatidyl-myo-inositol dimannoside synthase